MRGFKSFLIVSAILAAPSLLFASDPQWVEVRSPNFSVITDAGEKRGRDVALHFEQMRSVFGTLMTRASVNLSVPLQIVAFRNTKEIRQVSPLFNGKPTELAGLFQGGTDRSFIMLDMSVENPWAVVFHEYAHRLMDGNVSFRTDPWFEEGFAEYFSNIQVDNKEARVGKIPEETYQILQQLGMMKVSDLFRVQQNSKTYNESGSHRTTFYAESSLVVHYLYDKGLIPKLGVYFEALQGQKKPVAQAIQEAFAMTPEQFDTVLRDYLNSGRFLYYPIATPKNIAPAQFVVAPVSAADAQALLADIHSHSPDYGSKALAEFQEVLKIDPNNASALRGAGFAYMQNRDFEHAGDYLRRAAQLDSKDPRVHFYYAMLLNQQGPPDKTKSTEIKKQLEMTIALDPKMADAYSLLGYTQAFSGEPEKGMATLKKAVELSPRDEHYQFNLASVYLTNRKVDDAIAILKSLAGSSNPEVAMRANQMLPQAVNFKTQMKEFSSRNTLSIVENAEPSTGKDGLVIAVEQPESTPIHAPAPPHFLKGKLISVDCSVAPGAVLTMQTGDKTLHVYIRDKAHAVLIGADQLSCDWKNKNVALNYRGRPDGDGDLISLEIQ